MRTQVFMVTVVTAEEEYAINGDGPSAYPSIKMHGVLLTLSLTVDCIVVSGCSDKSAVL